MTGMDLTNRAVNSIKFLQTLMLYETDSFQKIIEEYKPKGEDCGKPSLKRTRREDVSKAHNVISKSEDRGKPALKDKTRRSALHIQLR